MLRTLILWAIDVQLPSHPCSVECSEPCPNAALSAVMILLPWNLNLGKYQTGSEKMLHHGIPPSYGWSSCFQLELLPSGKRLHSYWKLPFIVDLPIKNGDFPKFFVPEGIISGYTLWYFNTAVENQPFIARQIIINHRTTWAMASTSM